MTQNTEENTTQVSEVEAIVEPEVVEPTLEQQLADMKDAWLRAKAEAENQRRRSFDDMAKARKFALESFAEALLPVKDSLELALKTESPTVDSLKEGVEITLQQLSDVLKRNQITEVLPTVGDALDPKQHQAIATVASEQATNTVVSVMQTGYMIADRLLRPAMVTVAKAQVEDEQPS
jgi:molecular chaperone GrpE